MAKYTAIDLFSGAGGLSEGFMQTGAFEFLAHVEWEKPMVDTLRNNLIKRWNYNEEKAKSGWKEKYEEGRKAKKLYDDYYAGIEMIKQQKIAELKALNIKDKYILPVEKFNPIKAFKHG